MQATATAAMTAPPPKVIHKIPAKVQPTAAASGRPLRTVAYARVSTEKDEQELSFESQRDFYTDKIMRNPEMTFCGIYSDRGISGTQAKSRPGFQKMMRDAAAGKFDQILTKSVMRFARNTLDSLECVRKLKALGIGVIFETQGLDTRKMTNEFMLTIYSGMAQAESENISANVKWGRQKSFAKGNVSFSYGSFLGYRKGADGKPEIVPEEAVTIRRIYDSYLAGQTFRDIADSLTADGILTAMGKPQWSSQAVKSILKSEKYVGDAILQKTYVADCIEHRTERNDGILPQYYIENSHPAIIGRPIWNRVQEELARRSGKRKVKEVGTKTEQGKYSGKYALTELLICGECGTPYRRVTWSRNGQKKFVWRCISRLDYGKKYCKSSPTIEESVLKTAILESIANMARENTAVLDILKQHIGMELSGSTDSGDDPYALQSRMAELDLAIGELIEISAKESEEDYDSKFESLYAEKNALKEKLAEIKADNRHTSANQARLTEIFTILDGLKNHPLEWDERFIRQMIDCIKVMSKERIVIRFRMGTEVEANLR
jgi:DNA invertase Pin-like site-specific DNA recombinase